MKMRRNRIRKAWMLIAAMLMTVLLTVTFTGCGSGMVTDDETGNGADNPAGIQEETEWIDLSFRNAKLLGEHFEKHGIEMGFETEEDYEYAACCVVNNPDTLHKTEEEDGDDIYYLESTNEFVVVSTDGFIRTYFLPDKGKAYFDKQ